MNSRSLIASLTLIFIAILIWQLRWVLLVLFGSVVIAIALDVPIQRLRNKYKVARSLALTLVLFCLIISGVIFFQLLVPELIEQTKELGDLIPTLADKLNSILVSNPLLFELQKSLPEQFQWENIQPFGSKLLGYA